METLSKRKYIRLPPEAYANPANVFYITMDAVDRRRLFVAGGFNKDVIEQLSELAREKLCPVKIYCLMPSHLHLLISPGKVSVVRWVAVFKQKTQEDAICRAAARYPEALAEEFLRPSGAVE